MGEVTTITSLAIGIVAIATPLLIWLLKRSIDKSIGLRFDRLKKEHELSFSWQHQQVTKVATEIHQLFIEALNTLGWVAGTGYKIDTGPKVDDIRRLTEAIGKFNHVVSRDNLFLPKNIREKVEKAVGFLMFAHNAVLQAQIFLNDGDQETMSKAMSNAFELLNYELKPIRDALEIEFRGLLLGSDWGE